MCELFSIIFHRDTIFCIIFQNEPYIPVRPIVENLGLEWGAQAAKFRANKARWGVMLITTIAQDGKKREMLCLPLRKYPAWLASLNPNKVKPELRAKIELYQNESDDALWNYWMNGRAERPILTNPTSADAPLTPDQQSTLLTIMRTKVDSMEHVNKGARMQLFARGWGRFNNHFRIAKYCQLPQSKMAEAIAYLMKMELSAKAQQALPKSEHKPLYRDGCYYMLERDKNVPAGPREQALRDYWRKQFVPVSKSLDDSFANMMGEIQNSYGDIFSHMVSALAQNSNAMFNADIILDRVYSLENESRYYFKRAMECARLHLLSTISIARALNM